MSATESTGSAATDSAVPAGKPWMLNAQLSPAQHAFLAQQLTQHHSADDPIKLMRNALIAF